MALAAVNPAISLLVDLDKWGVLRAVGTRCHDNYTVQRSELALCSVGVCSSFISAEYSISVECY